MLNERTISLVTAYWAEHLNCAADALFSLPSNIVTHSTGLADYSGIFALFRDSCVTVSMPPNHLDFLRAILPVGAVTPASLSAAFLAHSSAVIGPAYIGYADCSALPVHPVRSLASSDLIAMHELRNACDRTEWEHGGCALDVCPASGVFFGGHLVAVAGYEIWGGSIAHISVITHPGFRGYGFARSVVAHLASRALSVRLIPQYRTLDSNLASIRVAEAVGFRRYASSVSIRIDSQGLKNAVATSALTAATSTPPELPGGVASDATPNKAG